MGRRPLVQGVRRIGELGRLSGEAFSFVHFPSASKDFRPNRAPRELGADVVARGVFLRHAAPLLGSRVVLELVERLGQVGGVR